MCSTTVFASAFPCPIQGHRYFIPFFLAVISLVPICVSGMRSLRSDWKFISFIVYVNTLILLVYNERFARTMFGKEGYGGDPSAYAICGVGVIGGYEICPWGIAAEHPAF
jgi:hypothetical protein